MNLQQRIQDTVSEGFTDISNQELVDFLLSIQSGSQFVAFTSVTARADLNKYDEYFIEVNGKKKKNPNAVRNPYFDGGILNFAVKKNLVTGFDYAKVVGKRMADAGVEEPFKKGESWHYPVSRTLSVHKNDENRFYLRYQYLDNSNSLLEHYHNSDRVAYALFERFLQDKKHYSNQIAQGVNEDDTCNIQVVGIENLLTLNINKSKFRLYENIQRFI